MAKPLAQALVSSGYSVWISDDDVRIGSSLPLRINDGLRSCRFGIAILSPAYLAKHWTMKELAALTSREEAERREIIIPILHELDRKALTEALPLWAPVVSDTWDGDAARIVMALGRTLGSPLTPRYSHQSVSSAIAAALSSGELDIKPRHEALVRGSGEVVTALGLVWRSVQGFNAASPKNLSKDRSRVRASMLADVLSAPSNAVRIKAEVVEAAALEYAQTLRRLVEMAEIYPLIESDQLVGLNEVYSGVVAKTFDELAALFAEKRVQTVTYPRSHPKLAARLDGIGNDLARLVRAFETLVDFCISELPARISVILEGRRI